MVMPGELLESSHLQTHPCWLKTTHRTYPQKPKWEQDANPPDMRDSGAKSSIVMQLKRTLRVELLATAWLAKRAQLKLAWGVAGPRHHLGADWTSGVAQRLAC